MWIYVDNDSRVMGYNPNNMEGNTGWVEAHQAPPEPHYDYLYINGEYVYNKMPTEELETQPSQLDIIEAQVTYTAMMTDTLLEG